MRSDLLFLGGGILIGSGFTWLEARRQAQISARKEFDEQLEMHKRVLNSAAEDFLTRELDGPFNTEEDLDGPDTSSDAVRVGGEMIAETALSDMTPTVDYLSKARVYSEVQLSNNVSPVSYISEDEFHEEDGRAKEQILIHMGEDEPLFISEGIVIPNWRELISPNILVDMYQRLTPDVENRVLYVRNAMTDTDYEVIQEIP